MATVDELLDTFGQGSPEREVQGEELRSFVEWAKTARIRRIIVNGSFVTGKLSPNDVDVIVLPDPDYPKMDEQPLDATWPFLQIIVAADDADLENWALKDFGTDRRWRPQRRRGVNPMSERLTRDGYEQTKRKLDDLASRLAAIETRTDLRGSHRDEVIRSYRRMMAQYVSEIKVFEASHRLPAK